MSKYLMSHYAQMWEEAIRKFGEGSSEPDALIDDPADERRGITLLARPSTQLSAQIVDFQNKLKQEEPCQYYYPTSDLHLTVLSIISCYTGFRLTDIEVADYVEVIETCLEKPIQICFRGITASPSGILIQGFPEGEGLEKLRNALREAFRARSLQHSIDSRYKINTAHITVARLRRPLTNPEKMVALLECFRDFSFGGMTISILDLVFNDWYQQARKVKNLHTFSLV
ncbi:AKAP7 2'5' RNA ligase-like domain-containing protein [Reichenbachiella carrageenanivorans]|uniref:AKAP7 2'5' RNA ligase-like domain-containing protein n=1 Tax=Reichenbachiella carrageenanivorans TaxID=2979869 RepID=A0ABY6D4V9_9BACT|nr:AKAP7 2'5' RNA ligase-like domain-containing protein [Reichenbachiella carrageenanivorans]UXX80098.1 AKAP7 2'5' RNA ligase-like domain-containing protein [Reichenbachiella carrageenanivorans]